MPTNDPSLWQRCSFLCGAGHCSNALFIYPGKPKGAMITHGNIASNTSSVIKILEVCLHFHLLV